MTIWDALEIFALVGILAVGMFLVVGSSAALLKRILRRK